MRRISRRQWRLWTTAFMVTLLLTLGIASFAFPGLLSQPGDSYPFRLDLVVRGLIGLVLLFNVYTLYQQLQINRLSHTLNDQIATLGTVEQRTEEVYKLAALDALTGLYNRRYAEQRLVEEISRSQRHGRPLTVLLLDIDGLKGVNDTLGHPAGDELIRYFAERLRKAIRGSDVAARMGGDEFIVLLPECKPEEVHLVLNRLSGMAVTIEEKRIALEFSAGWTDHLTDEAPEETLKRADAALYANKRAAKNQNILSPVAS